MIAITWQGLAPFGGWGSWQSGALFWGFVVVGGAVQLALGRETRTLLWVVTLHLALVGALVASATITSIPLVSAHIWLGQTPDRLTPEQVRDALRSGRGEVGQVP
jgi:hypothetical protein